MDTEVAAAALSAEPRISADLGYLCQYSAGDDNEKRLIVSLEGSKNLRSTPVFVGYSLEWAVERFAQLEGGAERIAVDGLGDRAYKGVEPTPYALGAGLMIDTSCSTVVAFRAGAIIRTWLCGDGLDADAAQTALIEVARSVLDDR